MRRISKVIKAALIIAGILVACIGYSPTNTHATTGTISLTAMPAILDTAGKAGEKKTVSFELKNNSEIPVPIHMSTRDSRVREGQSEEIMRSLSAKGWVTFAEEDFILQPLETKTIMATLAIPEGTPAGGHYTDLVVQTLSLQKDDGLVDAQPELGVQVLIGVAGEIHEKLSLDIKGGSRVVKSPSKEKELVFTVANTGNIHSLFVPTIYITNRDGSETPTTLEPQILLPSETREISFMLPSDLPSGLRSVQMRFRYAMPPQDIGSPVVQVIALPFDARLLLVIPLAAIAIYGYRIRDRIGAAQKALLKGVDKQDEINPKK